MNYELLSLLKVGEKYTRDFLPVWLEKKLVTFQLLSLLKIHGH